MRIDTLSATPFETITATFDLAFGDYAVTFSSSAAWLGEMMRRRGVRLELSVGVRDEESLVAFTLNGIGSWRGEVTGYDCGTGVIPEYRGRRLTALMLEKTAEVLQEAGATHYLLEVLQSNEKAIRAYRGAGFETTRELCCRELDTMARSSRAGITVIEEPSFDPVALAAMRDSEPSWQNGDESVARAGDPRLVLSVRDDAGLAGCAVLFPKTNDLAQLAVARRARRRGIGTALVAAARARCAKPMRILNIDARDGGTNAFFAAIGANETVRQFEMIKRLD
ncbi:MAG: GNAT family N-acetyltransferase [Thermoanaerobaculia bacterium]|jgi:ribosomal protein S18 acetylase RimI-like enzyme